MMIKNRISSRLHSASNASRKLKRLAYTALPFIMPCTSLAGSNDLCKASETTLFSCEVSKERIVSFCKSDDINSTKLFYRFGKPNSIELEYGDIARGYDNSQNSFFTNASSTDAIPFYFQIGVKIKNYSYSILRYLRANDDHTKHILLVKNHEKNTAARMTCLKHIQIGEQIDSIDAYFDEKATDI